MSSESPATPEPAPDEGRSVPRIEDAYLDRAIREMHLLEERMDGCTGCAAAGTFPVKASGSPTADIMLIKWQSSLSERQEGVSFYGRPGEAVRRSVERLQVDPSALYGTLVLKCPHADPSAPMGDELEWLAEEIRIVRPRLIVVMGDRSIGAMDALKFPMAEPLPVEQGVVTRWTPSIEALVTPDIDDSLDEQDAKRRFWAAFRALGDWYAAEPPW
ncbi:MAG: uracil-DNA glycosylase family protein [Miltoncostaeaceae bacterium]